LATARAHATLRQNQRVKLTSSNMARKSKRKTKVRPKAKAKPKQKTGRKASAPARRASKTAKAAKPDPINTLIAASAEALALPLDPAWRDSVAFNVRLILSHAAKVEAFPLPDDSEPAPVFHA
jgi:Protein of unknown function (DUF4089)